jgi:hypothetical protein
MDTDQNQKNICENLCSSVDQLRFARLQFIVRLVTLGIMYNSMNTDHVNQTITLKDGRKLGFAEYGDPEGKAVFHFHGGAGSRLERPAEESILTDLGLRLVSTGQATAYPTHSPIANYWIGPTISASLPTIWVLISSTL